MNRIAQSAIVIKSPAQWVNSVGKIKPPGPKISSVHQEVEMDRVEKTQSGNSNKYS
jgi:hypothetical protein